MLCENQLADRTAGGGWLFSHLGFLSSSQGPLEEQASLERLELALVHLHNISELHLLHEAGCPEPGSDCPLSGGSGRHISLGVP